MESLVQVFTVGFLATFQPFTFLLLVLGVFWGMIFGAIPGLTAAMGVALAIPFTFFMSAVDGLTLLTGIWIGGVSGGLISACLLNMPGTPSSITSCFDGYPMSQKGKSGQALGIAITSSAIGGLLGVLVLMTLAPFIARQALKFGPFEYFSLGVLAFVAVSSMLGGSIWRNLTGLAMGLAISSIGADPISGIPRLCFGISELQGGIALLPLLVGLFCVSEIIEDIGAEMEAIVPPEARKVKLRELLPPFEVFKSNFANLIRSFVIGLTIGIFPGIGGATSNVIAYGMAKSSSKHPEKFGTGIPDGIIASETANNASIGGAFIPLVALGIPGDAVTAILLGGFMIHGINPGPLLFRYSADLVYAVFSAQFWANVVMFVMGLFLIKLFIYSLSFPKKFLLPIIAVSCILGAFALNNRVFDIWVLVFFGIFGYAWNKMGFSLVPVLVAFVLGPVVEANLRQGLTESAGSFLPIFTRPISLGLLIAAAALFLLGRYLQRIMKRRRVSGI